MRQQIYNALFKETKEVELSKVEVELSLVEDSIKLFKKGLSTFDNASKIRQEAARQYVEAKDDFDIAIKTISEVQKKVKDLGLPMPSELNTAFEESKRLSKISDSYIKELR
jgi:hypothetical protein